MSDLKSKLIKLGSKRPDLRPHIKKILTAGSFTAPSWHIDKAMSDLADSTFDMFERRVLDGTYARIVNPSKFRYGWKFEHGGTEYQIIIAMRGDGHIMLHFQDPRKVLVSGGGHFEDFAKKDVLDFIDDVAEELGF